MATNRDEELAALQMVVLALIRAQPDRKAFAATFDKEIAEWQTQAAKSPRGLALSDDMREALQRWRRLMEAG